MILVLGGTKDARELAVYLAENSFPVLLTVTTALAESFAGSAAKVRVGKLTASEFDQLLETENVSAVIDATHPFAEQISALAYRQSELAAIPYFRLERPEIDYPEGVIFAEDFTAAAKCITAGKVFAAIGVRHLQEFVTAGDFSASEVFIRVLPASLEEGLAAGIPKENIFTGLGPFSYGDNLEHFSKAGVKWLVTKASGPFGGEREKLATALALNMQVVVVQRPPKQGRKLYTYQQTLEELRRGI